MKLPVSVLDRDMYYAEILQLLNDKDCFIIIDTNILASFFRLHDKARNELLAWLTPYIDAKRLRTPAWALNEYTKKFVRNHIPEYLSTGKKLDTIKNDFSEAKKFLSLHIDPNSLPPGIYADAAAYEADLKEFEKILSRFKNLLKTSGTDYINGINEVLKAKFDGTVLNSDIFTLSQQVSVTGPIRFLNQLPPGYEDDRKGFNPFGDLIIWEEIIEFTKTDSVKKAIYLSNDMKRDWMYAPQRIKIKTVEGPNKEAFKIVDPRLVFQFNLASGTDNFHIVNLETLTHILIDAGTDKLYNLAKALQIERVEDIQQKIKEAKAAEAIAAKEQGVIPEFLNETEEIETPEVLEILNHAEGELPNDEQVAEDAIVINQQPEGQAPQPAGLAFGFYTRSALVEKEHQFVDQRIGDIVTRLRSYNWYIQNPAIDELRKILLTANERQPFNHDDIFILGRNIYQSATGGAYAAVQFIQDNVIANIPSNETKIDLVSGMAYEIFFDSFGQLRRPNYKIAFLDEIFTLFRNPIYGQALEFIRNALGPFEAALLVLPSEHPEPLTFTIGIFTDVVQDFLGDNLEHEVIESVTFADIELLIDNNGSINYHMKPYLNEEDIKTEIKRAFGIPSWQQNLQFNPEKTHRFVMPGNHQLLWRGPLPAAPVVEDLGF